jgi:hypothetical protein
VKSIKSLFIEEKMLSLRITNVEQEARLIKRKLLVTDPWYRLILHMLADVIADFKCIKMLEVGCGFGGFCIARAL